MTYYIRRAAILLDGAIYSGGMHSEIMEALCNLYTEDYVETAHNEGRLTFGFARIDVHEIKNNNFYDVDGNFPSKDYYKGAGDLYMAISIDKPAFHDIGNDYRPGDGDYRTQPLEW